MFQKTDATSVPEESASIGERSTMHAGFSKVEITPPLDCIRAFGLGYWFQRNVRFRGVRDPLYARALVLGDDSALQVVISVDAILDTYRFIPEAQHEISSRLNIPPNHVFIACTHTHSAPLIGVNRTGEGAGYGTLLVSRIVEAAIAAYAKRVPTTVGLSRVRVPGAIRNRRPLLRNGRIAELHAPVAPAEIADFGPVNDVLTLIKFRDKSGSVAGEICHFGIHGVAVQGSDLISSDCMGRAIQRFENDTDGGIMLHLNAPCADIDPIAMGDENALEEMTALLHAGLRDVNAAPERVLSLTPQQTVGTTFRAKRRSTRSKEELAGKLADLPAVAQGSDHTHHSGPGYERFLLEEEQAVAELPAEFDIPYQILRAGDLLWIGIGGEVFTRTGQHLARIDNRLAILPVGITGASAGYLPTSEMFSQGGYEVSCARWCSIAPGQAEKLFESIERDARSVAGVSHR